MTATFKSLFAGVNKARQRVTQAEKDEHAARARLARWGKESFVKNLLRRGIVIGETKITHPEERGFNGRRHKPAFPVVIRSIQARHPCLPPDYVFPKGVWSNGKLWCFVMCVDRPKKDGTLRSEYIHMYVSATTPQLAAKQVQRWSQ